MLNNGREREPRSISRVVSHVSSTLRGNPKKALKIRQFGYKREGIAIVITYSSSVIASEW
jgi:hypothetical protein